MKKIEAIIRPEKLDSVRHALEEISSPGLMITEIEGHGKQKGITRQWRGKEYKVELLSKIKIEVIVKDKDVGHITKAITEAAYTGSIGDGKIFVYPVENVSRIRTREEGESAI